MMPHSLPTTTPRGNTVIARILIAVDDSEHSARALRYVGTLLRDVPNVQVTLFHVLKPMPRELLEHGGSEDPAEEIRLAEELRQDQANWVRAESVTESPILVTALELFGKTGFPLDRVTLKFGHEDDIAHNILAEARIGCYGTIVISRHGWHGLKHMISGGVTDHLLRDASGFTLWMVE
jgi:nucleotide-binding universal stress UspA family protein